jgi:hypothetical protein
MTLKAQATKLKKGIGAHQNGSLSYTKDTINSEKATYRIRENIWKHI